MSVQDIFWYYEEKKDLLIIGERGVSEYQISDFKYKMLSQKSDLKNRDDAKKWLLWAKEESQCVDFEELKPEIKLLQ